MARIRTIKPEFFTSKDEFATAEIVYEGPVPEGAQWRQLAESQYLHSWVYVLHGEAGILYVGKARVPQYRVAVHRQRKVWWPDVTTISLIRLEGVDNRAAERSAYALEAYLIGLLEPAHNIVRPRDAEGRPPDAER